MSACQNAELVVDQKIPTWLALHRRAFESFGGAAHKVVIGNLKAAVLSAALHDPVLDVAGSPRPLHQRP